ncbi:hypothetical protein [Halobacterium sp. KA-6]|uniref:hypothetical protein n=1 Tax=Halobacterium sp. KA-6 TaxID=2896368 RepID=UPI001E5C4138|nr:hypothetical protein [Halobacterium sp. KA-6]MCD2201892.1 hypothetical protein [Halobacterium sp. KA-6]
MTDDPSILTVGSEIDQVADSKNWDESYNIKGYDCVFLDLYSLAERLDDEKPDGNIQTPNDSSVMRAMAAGNQIYVLVPESNEISYSNRILPLDRIIPGQFSLVEESGKYVDLDSVAEDWEWYFNSHFNWNLRLGMDSEIFEVDRQRFSLNQSPIVQNKSEESIAWEFIYRIVVQTNTGSKLDELDGRVVFLPIIEGVSPSELIESLIEHEVGITLSADQKNNPEWTSDWSLPGEDDAKTQAEELKKEIERKQKTLETLEEEITEYDRYKTLLWGNERALEQLVPEVFEEVGFDVDGETPHGRDGMIHLDDRSFVMEVTGTTNDIRDKKYEQLLGWVADAEADYPKTRIDGLLVVNPRREEKPSERNPDEYLPPHLRQRLNRRDFKLLLTPTLYEMLEAYRASDIDTEDLRKSLLTDDLVIEI